MAYRAVYKTNKISALLELIRIEHECKGKYNVREKYVSTVQRPGNKVANMIFMFKDPLKMETCSLVF